MKADPARTLIVIPARGGSKRLPRKNVLPLGGRPLIRHATDVAVDAGPFGAILVSTDDQEISDAIKGVDGVTIDDRDPGLAGDKIKVIDVMVELCSRSDIRNNFDVLGMMLPTCPLRNAADIRGGFEMLDDKCDAVISFTEYEFSPLCAVRLDEDSMMSPVYDPSPLITGNTRSQDQIPIYRPNGAFFFIWIEALLRLKSFYAGKVKGFVMPRQRSVDIDDGEDFAHAEWALSRLEAQA